VARILIIGGGCRGRMLAREMAQAGHVLRITTRSEDQRAAIEASGAECWIATPARVGTLRAALEGVTLACWLLAGASGAAEDQRALHGSRLELFMRQVIDTTVRGFIYEASIPAAQSGGSAVPAGVLGEGARIARAMGARNAIPVAVIEGTATDAEGWLSQMRAAARSLLGSVARPG
jgi:glycine/D-amino acid oxidase-like deaminating enzyme